MPKAGLVDIRAIHLNVDEMPCSRACTCVVDVLVAIFIGPCCLGCDVMGGEIACVRGKKGIHFLPNRRIKVGLGYQRHDLVPFVLPGQRSAQAHPVSCSN